MPFRNFFDRLGTHVTLLGGIEGGIHAIIGFAFVGRQEFIGVLVFREAGAMVFEAYCLLELLPDFGDGYCPDCVRGCWVAQVYEHTIGPVVLVVNLCAPRAWV